MINSCFDYNQSKYNFHKIIFSLKKKYIRKTFRTSVIKIIKSQCLCAHVIFFIIVTYTVKFKNPQLIYYFIVNNSFTFFIVAKFII